MGYIVWRGVVNKVHVMDESRSTFEKIVVHGGRKARSKEETPGEKKLCPHRVTEEPRRLFSNGVRTVAEADGTFNNDAIGEGLFDGLAR